MRTTLEYTHEMATLASLLAKGYFPRELPPPFNTLSYARYAKKFGPSWETGRWTRCVDHNLARPGGFRRPLKIPPDALESEHWLLAYEANQQGWLHVPAVSKDSVFSAMAASGVTFYDRSKIKPQFPQGGRTFPGGALWSDYA